MRVVKGSLTYMHMHHHLHSRRGVSGDETTLQRASVQYLTTLMSTHTSTCIKAEYRSLNPRGPDMTALTTGTNRALPASDTRTSCSTLNVCMCVHVCNKGIFCGWIFQIIAWQARISVVCGYVYWSFSWENPSWNYMAKTRL